MKKKSIISLLAVLTFVCSFALGVLADDMRKTIEAIECKDIYLTYNGDEFLARDGNEEVVYPLILNGTTYLPVRAVTSIAGLKVDWDGDTRTVHLTSSDYVATDDTGYSLETEINDTKADANILPVDGGKFKGRVGETLSTGVDKKDMYKFVVDEQGIVDIKVTGDPESEVSVAIRDMDGDELDWIGSAPADGVYHYRLPMSTGTYYLDIDYDYEEMAYKIDTAFTATPDDYEKDNSMSDVPPVSFTGSPMTFKGAVGTNLDYYKDTIVIENFDSYSYSIEMDWIGEPYSGIRVDLYNEADYTIENIYFDKFKEQVTVSGELDEKIDKVVIYITPENSTTICNEYSFTVGN